MADVKIAAIVGSPPPGRHARAVAEWVHRQAAERHGADYDLVDLADYPWPERPLKITGHATQLVVYGREATRINGNHEWLTSNVIGWWTNKYGLIGSHRERCGVNPLVAGSSPARPTLKGRSGVLQASRTSQLPSSAHNSECVTRVPSKRNSCAGRRRGSMVVSACTMTPPPEGIPSPVAAPFSK
jgi:hypothetical protein